MLPELKDCTLALEQGVATLTFERDDVRNALTGTALVDDIIASVDWINDSEAVGALIISGSGKAFSSGGNVKDMANRSGAFSGDEDELAEHYRFGIQRMPLALSQLKVPSIAAINGPAIGAGFDLCNMCDFRIASEHARFGETFINLGIIPGDGGAWFLQRLIGYQKAAELTFTGRIIDAEEANSLGLLLKLVKHENLMKECTQLAREIAAKPRYALRKTKYLMQEAQSESLSDFLNQCATIQARCHHHPEHEQAIKDFLARMAKKS